MPDYERYQGLPPLADNIGQTITAQHINTLQDIAMVLQRRTFRMKDEDFKQLALFTLEHHPGTNAMILDFVSSNARLDWTESENIAWSAAERAVAYDPVDPGEPGLAAFLPYSSPDNCIIGELVLLAACYCPGDATLTFEVSADGEEFHPIRVNIGEVFVLPNPTSSVFVRAQLNPDGTTGRGPRLDGLALLYRNEQIDPVLQ